ncbi:MAG: DNA-processing protein DprA [Ruminococcus sp.]|jgi:DNA processing protein|nr:DNA-processing protein DprA [Ruminococcus sp.]
MLDFSVSQSDMMWYRLSLMFEPGNNRLFETFRANHDNISQTYTYITENTEFADSLPEAEKKIFTSVTDEMCEGIIAECAALGISIITYGSRFYPNSLRTIYNPPAVLYCKGDVSLLSAAQVLPSLGVVGARDSSEYSTKTAEKLIRELFKVNKYLIISGFAVGTDIASHLAAIRAGGKTIAVKGCGLDYNYPEPNLKYTDEIEKNGLFISEYPPGKPPKAMNFPIRNRIIAALSDAVLVTEGGVKSGALSTANLAADFGKDVFVIPPRDIFDKDYSGNIALLQDGAIPVYSPSDILIHSPIFISTVMTELSKRSKEDIEASFEASEEVVITNEKAAGEWPGDSYFNSDISILDEASREVYGLIKASPDEHNADSLADNFSGDPDMILDIVTELELKRFIYRSPEGYYL